MIVRFVTIIFGSSMYTLSMIFEELGLDIVEYIVSWSPVYIKLVYGLEELQGDHLNMAVSGGARVRYRRIYSAEGPGL